MYNYYQDLVLKEKKKEENKSSLYVKKVKEHYNSEKDKLANNYYMKIKDFIVNVRTYVFFLHKILIASK